MKWSCREPLRLRTARHTAMGRPPSRCGLLDPATERRLDPGTARRDVHYADMARGKVPMLEHEQGRDTWPSDARSQMRCLNVGRSLHYSGDATPGASSSMACKIVTIWPTRPDGRLRPALIRASPDVGLCKLLLGCTRREDLNHHDDLSRLEKAHDIVSRQSRHDQLRLHC
jgi:hypothetical protein